jgi:hypothetical protein
MKNYSHDSIPFTRSNLHKAQTKQAIRWFLGFKNRASAKV